jgi:hypothetical protein
MSPLRSIFAFLIAFALLPVAVTLSVLYVCSMLLVGACGEFMLLWEGLLNICDDCDESCDTGPNYGDFDED